MKKLLSVLLALVLTLSLAAVAMAQIETKITGEVSAGYMNYPGFDEDFMMTDFSKGAFFAQYRWFNARFTKEVSPIEQLTAGVVFQIEFYDTQQNRSSATFPNPVQNFYAIYDAGFAKFYFDAKGREVKLGIADEEPLKLNVARRYTGDGEPNIYRSGDDLAKQLTVEVPFEIGKAVAVVSLEQVTDGEGENKKVVGPVDFVGAYAQFYVGGGVLGIGYQTDMVESCYKNKILDPYFVVCADYDIIDNVRLQVDYSNRTESGEKRGYGWDGYYAYWRGLWFEKYNGTPFRINQFIHATVTIGGEHKIDAKLMPGAKTAADEEEFKYWLDASYKLDPFRVGVNYRNWAYSYDNFEGDLGDFAVANEKSVVEIYGVYEAGPEIRVFYRTDSSFGALVKIGFW